MKIELLKEKREFLSVFSDKIKEGGYQNNFLLTDIFDLINLHEDKDVSELKSFWRDHIEKIKNGKAKDNLSFYLHIPFCRSKCNYCMYNSKPIRDFKDVKNYIDELIKVMGEFGDVFKDIKFKSLYIGGGTPSILSSVQIKRLLEYLFNNFKFEDEGEKTFECNPDSIDKAKLDIIKGFRMNRISFGVQSLNKDVLISENRGYQEYKKIKEIVAYAKNIGFEEVNVDLMIGLSRDNQEVVLESLKLISELKPDFISLYPLQPISCYCKNLESFYDNLALEIKEFSKLLEQSDLDKNYNIKKPSLDNPRTASPWYFSSKSYKKMRYTYSFGSPEENSCFGIGEGACSYIHNSLRYQQKEWSFDCIKIGKKDQRLHYLMEELAYDVGADLERYKVNLGSDALSDFSDAIEELKDLDLIKVEGNNLKLLSTNPKDRFIDALFFFDFDKIIRKFRELSSNMVHNECFNIKLGNKCNNNCVFCFDKEENSDITSVKVQVAKALSSGAKKITFTGGEPTIYHKQLLNLISFFSNRGYETAIVTNGRMLALRKFADELVGNGLKEFIISVHGYKEVNDKMTNVSGGYDQIVQGIKNISQYEKVSITVQSTCTKDNIGSIPEMMKDMIGNGVKKFNLQGVLPKGLAAKKSDRFLIEYDELKQVLRKIVRLKKEYDLDIHFEFMNHSYFEDYIELAPDKNDILYYLGEALGLTSSKKIEEFMGCKANACHVCFLNNVCKRCTHENSYEREIVLHKFNLDKVADSLKTDNNLIFSLIEPFDCIEDYKLLLPNFNEIKSIFGNIESGFCIKDIPRCVIDKNNVNYETAVYSNLRDICRTRKVKSVRCNDCVYSSKCDGIFVDCSKILGFSNISPIKLLQVIDFQLIDRLINNVFPNLSFSKWIGGFRRVYQDGILNLNYPMEFAIQRKGDIINYGRVNFFLNPEANLSKLYGFLKKISYLTHSDNLDYVFDIIKRYKSKFMMYAIGLDLQNDRFKFYFSLKKNTDYLKFITEDLPNFSIDSHIIKTADIKIFAIMFDNEKTRSIEFYNNIGDMIPKDFVNSHYIKNKDIFKNPVDLVSFKYDFKGNLLSKNAHIPILMNVDEIIEMVDLPQIKDTFSNLNVILVVWLLVFQVILMYITYLVFTIYRI